MIFTTDDLCLEYLSNFYQFDAIKREFPEFKLPEFKLIAFAISNFKNRENLRNDETFKDWYANHKDWVEIAVHSYDHDGIPDGDRDDEELWIKKALEGLKPFLPKEYGYRSPGWQTTNKTEDILRKLGFSYIAYETKIKHLNNNQIESGVVNSHLYDRKSIDNIHEIFRHNIEK